MKDHEKTFFKLCFYLNRICTVRDIVNLVSDTIPRKRCWYYLRKWSELEFYNYGVTLDLGWIETYMLPDRYRDLIETNKPKGRDFHEKHQSSGIAE